MAKTLLEAYAKPIAIAESYYASKHDGEAMDTTRKLVLASCLRNVNKKLHEAFGVAQATQKAGVAWDGTGNPKTALGVGSWEKFTMNLVNAAVPNLIAFDLCIVAPMKDWTGFVTYVEYLKGTNKGISQEGDLINGVFGLGPAQGKEFDKNYTGNIIVEPVTATASTTYAFTPTPSAADPNYAPIDGTFTFVDANGVAYKQGASASDTDKTFTVAEASGVYTLTFAAALPAGASKLSYHYDNIVIPQKAESLPTLNMVIKSIPLVAKARRIVINYAQIAQFQAQTEYGLDMNKALAEQATAELQYEIDTEIVEMLRDAAKANGAIEPFDLVEPIGVSKQDHYASFVDRIDLADQKIYDITRKFQCTYMVAGSGIKQVLRFCPEWKPATTANVVGPYFAGTLGHLKVFITPSFDPYEFIFGVNGSDLMTSAAVYAPYLAVVPTQLLQTPDGATAQGFSTVYDAKIINANLLVYGTIVPRT